MIAGFKQVDSTPIRSPLPALAVLGIVGAAVAGCGPRGLSSSSEPGVTADSSATGENQAVTLIVSGDTAGWIVPCGCTSNQSGGLLRRGTFVADRREGEQVIVADAGGAPGGTSDYQRMKFEAILRGELIMGIAAHNLGAPEAALGPDVLRPIESDLQVPFVSANLRDPQGRLVTSACRIVEAGGRKIAFIGVLTARQKISGCQIDDPRDAILSTIESMKDKPDQIVVLAWLPEAELRDLAAALPEVDAVIGGPTGQSLPPEVTGPTLVASATNKGKFLACVTIPASGRRPASWGGEVVELSERFADDHRQSENLGVFRQALAAADFSALSTGLGSPMSAGPGPDAHKIAGSQSCQACHIDEYQAWRDSRHAHAWETLVRESSHVDPECQRCHTTGYGLSGGFESIARSAERTAVGCESCHGPSQRHVEHPESKKTPLAARDACQRCHDRENSPQFEFADYWEQIIHGRPVATDSGSPSAR